MNTPYRIGLDVGIGSTGWAVISGNKEKSLIQDFGVRIYDSGEINGGKNRKSQERRGFRSTRRVLRRRYYRKERLKAHLNNIGLISSKEIEDFDIYEMKNIFAVKVKALEEKIDIKELWACLLHICNHRGYLDFYENKDETVKLLTVDDAAEKEEQVNKIASKTFDNLLKDSNCKSVSELICTKFVDKKTGLPTFRNIESREDHLLIRREHIRNEMLLILDVQKKYYPQLTQNSIDLIDKIIFSQRAFEDGPGNANEAFRRYAGFLDSIGRCPFYKDKLRGFRCTVIGDIYAMINTLSQYKYFSIKNGEYDLPSHIAKLFVTYALKNAEIKMTDIKNILKENRIEMQKSDNCDDKALGKSFRFLKLAKHSIEKAGKSWEDFIFEEQFDITAPSKLHLIAETLAKNITPSRRKTKLESLPFMTKELIKTLSALKVSGTANVSDHFMCDAIQAFMNGEIYGNFQARVNKESEQKNENMTGSRTIKLPPSILDDEDIKDNPVVFRAVNETRKVLNAIIGTYGSPEYINIEIASDLNRSFMDREKLHKKQKKNEEERDKIKDQIAELVGSGAINENNVDKFKLYKEQNGKCLYSGKELDDIKTILLDKGDIYEIDHIIPQSLILDNTLQNKALVFSSENQIKKQRTPLMYLKGEKSANFIARVNHMYSRKENPISKKKYSYLMLPDLYSEEAQSMLQDWKSRNINDTRYITKYIVNLLAKNLVFSGNSKMPVYGIKGAITSKFRRIWLNSDTWGAEEKDRATYLNHAVDAVVIANLTPSYVEIASDSIRLYQLSRRSGKNSSEYSIYLDSCISKMKKYYGFPEEYTRKILTQNKRIPSFVANLREEVDIRFNDHDPSLFNKKTQEFYGDCADFIIKPHMPLVSIKQEKKFRGTIADSNPIKLREINGSTNKISRKKISELSVKDLDKLYTKDTDLINTLKRIFNEKEDKYKISEYMEETKSTKFYTDKGQPVYRVSLVEGKVSSYYKKEIGEGNYSILGMPKYYCIEIYKNNKNQTKTYGIRYVDIIKKDKKLFIKQETLPKDYKDHICYLLKNDYVEIYDGKGEIKFSGYYNSVKTIGRNLFYCKPINLTEDQQVSITQNDLIKKYSIDILGRKGGEIKCSAPLSLIQENVSRLETTGLWSWQKTKNNGSL